MSRWWASIQRLISALMIHRTGAIVASATPIPSTTVAARLSG